MWPRNHTGSAAVGRCDSCFEKKAEFVSRATVNATGTTEERGHWTPGAVAVPPLISSNVMSGCLSGRPAQHMLLHHPATGRVLTSLISLRGWCAAAAPPSHGHAARWRGSHEARAAAATDGATAPQQHEQQQQGQQHDAQQPHHDVPTTAFGKVHHSRHSRKAL